MPALIHMDPYGGSFHFVAPDCGGPNTHYSTLNSRKGLQGVIPGVYPPVPVPDASMYGRGLPNRTSRPPDRTITVVRFSCRRTCHSCLFSCLRQFVYYYKQHELHQLRTTRSSSSSQLFATHSSLRRSRQSQSSRSSTASTASGAFAEPSSTQSTSTSAITMSVYIICQTSKRAAASLRKVQEAHERRYCSIQGDNVGRDEYCRRSQDNE